MQKPKHIVIVAGEESGDKHASVIINNLKKTNPELKISGIGGQHMQNAGAQMISDLARFGVAGLTEVFRYIFVIKNAFTLIKKHLEQTQPDLLILIDYPGFNLRLAKYAKKKLNLKILYYISPQIWAWKANRIHTIKKNIDTMAVIFPFEKNIYKTHGVNVSFVGHPLTSNVKTSESITTIRSAFNLPLDKKVLALLPGSRSQEIERHLPIMLSTAKDLLHNSPDLNFVIPIASSIKPQLIKYYIDKYNIKVTLIMANAIKVITASDLVVVASGTASLECALLEKPMCIIYKTSFITYIAASFLMRVKYLGLCNLLFNKMLVPELLQYDLNKAELKANIERLLFDDTYRNTMINNLKDVRKVLEQRDIDCDIITLINNNIQNKEIA